MPGDIDPEVTAFDPEVMPLLIIIVVVGMSIYAIVKKDRKTFEDLPRGILVIVVFFLIVFLLRTCASLPPQTAGRIVNWFIVICLISPLIYLVAADGRERFKRLGEGIGVYALLFLLGLVLYQCDKVKSHHDSSPRHTSNRTMVR